MTDVQTMKVCSKCSEAKPEGEFSQKPKGQCVDCIRAYKRKQAAEARARDPERARERVRQFYWRHRDRVRAEQNAKQRVAPPTHLTCHGCKRHMAVGMFQRRGARGLRYTKYCNDCHHPTAHVRKRKAALKAAAGNFNQSHVRAKYRLQQGVCYYCKEQLGQDYHIEHKIPVSRGGSNWPANICVACPDCNRRKHDKTPLEFMPGLYTRTCLTA